MHIKIHAKSKPTLLPLVTILVQKWIWDEVATAFNSSYISNRVKLFNHSSLKFLDCWDWAGNLSQSASGVDKLEFSWDQEQIKTVIEYEMFFYCPRSFVTDPASTKIVGIPSAETQWNLWWLNLMKTSEYQRYQNTKGWMSTENIWLFSPNLELFPDELGALC